MKSKLISRKPLRLFKKPLSGSNKKKKVYDKKSRRDACTVESSICSKG